MSADDDLSRPSLLDLFREEVQQHSRVLSAGLLTLEQAPTDAAALEACMRAAHSMKGAARIIGLQEGVEIAHLMEECFVAVQQNRLSLSGGHIDELLRGVDLLQRVGELDDTASFTREEIDTLMARLDVPEIQAPAHVERFPEPTAQLEPARQESPAQAILHAAQALLASDAATLTASSSLAISTSDASTSHAATTDTSLPKAHVGVSTDPGRMLRVRADHLDRLLSLSGESLVESRWLKPFADTMLRIKRTQHAAGRALDTVYDSVAERLDPPALAALDETRRTLNAMQQLLAARIDELDRFDRRNLNLAQQLYGEALQCRMRPFGDATSAYPRIVRDLARSLGKRVRFSIVGETTQVDRDILDLLDAPLGHLLRNALDHGIEAPQQRAASGKPEDASLVLEARHSAGKLLISVSDDGAGIDLEKLRATVVRRRLADQETADRLSDQELLEFLLLPGFSMREQVSDLSGRGVGLDAVHEMVKTVRGTVRIHNEAGSGTRVVLQLPLTLSVIRSLLVEVGGEAYAFALAHVLRTLKIARNDIDMLEGHQHFSFEGRRVGLVTANQLLGATFSEHAETHVFVIVVGSEHELYGITVDRFLGERMLVVQPLDSRLGKIKDIAAGALMENGDVVLIVDIEDILLSIQKLVRGGRLDKVTHASGPALQRRKHVLVVDDSLTVRELERKLLEKRGYTVTVAVDGMDGWNTVRSADVDLVVTDIDMPRMDGIALITLIKRDAILKNLPVMIVSYKDREEDRRRGLDAGADHYLAKGNFHDDALFDAVRDLIGEAQE